jgi:hypothetical protein
VIERKGSIKIESNSKPRPKRRRRRRELKPSPRGEEIGLDQSPSILSFCVLSYFACISNFKINNL